MPWLEALPARVARVSMVLAVVLGLGACITPGESLPPGEYVSDDGRERITVEDSGRIRFRVRVDGSGTGELTDRAFDNHQIWAQSKTIRPVPMKTRDAVHGVGKYTWRWRDGRIAKTSKSGKVLAWFARRN